MKLKTKVRLLAGWVLLTTVISAAASTEGTIEWAFS
jgi:hypothetical protein